MNTSKTEAVEQINRFFYYLRDKQNRPVVTVCIVECGGKFARGVAICSPLDNPNKKIGRMIAEGRAFKALEKGSGDEIWRGPILLTLHELVRLNNSNEIVSKSVNCGGYLHPINMIERKLIGNLGIKSISSALNRAAGQLV